MYEHKMYQKVTSVPQCLGEGGTGAKPTLAQLALGQVAGLPGFHLVSFDQWCPSIRYTSYIELVTTWCGPHPSLVLAGAVNYLLQVRRAQARTVLETAPVWDSWGRTPTTLLSVCFAPFRSTPSGEAVEGGVDMMLTQKDGRRACGLALWSCSRSDTRTSVFSIEQLPSSLCSADSVTIPLVKECDYQMASVAFGNRFCTATVTP